MLSKKRGKQILYCVYHASTNYWWFIKHLFVYHRISTHLEDLIKGKKVLILGSGPSAQMIQNLHIPNNTVVMAANLAPKLIPKNHISVYITTNLAMSESLGEIANILKTHSFDTIIVNNRKVINVETTNAENIITFDPKDNNYLIKLLNHRLNLKKRISFKCAQKSQHLFLSSGMQLLQYALFFGASEILLAGIDTKPLVTYSTETTYKSISKHKKNNHFMIDSLFIEFCSLEYNNISVLSKSSPLFEYFPLGQFSASL